MQNEDADNKYKANLSEEDSAQQRNSKVIGPVMTYLQKEFRQEPQ